LEIGARATSIDERAKGITVPSKARAQVEVGSQRLRTWCKYAANGDLELFEEILRQRGLRIETAHELLGDVTLADADNPPPWLETLQWVFLALSTSEWDSAEDGRHSDHPVPFEDLLAPLVAQAWPRCERTLRVPAAKLFSSMGRRSLARRLLVRLSDLLSPTLLEGFHLFRLLRQPWMHVLVLESEDARSRVLYLQYVDHLRNTGLRDYFLDRPVLARLLSHVVDHWITTTAELAARLSADMEVVLEFLGHPRKPTVVCDVIGGLSDPHEGGRSVSILVFEGGNRLVYKPRDVGLDRAWARFLDWLRAHGAPSVPAAPAVLTRESYGWTEWIGPEECTSREDVGRFYRRAGSLLFLLQMLQGIDFHFENVIAQGDQPVAVDLETLLQPRLAKTLNYTGPSRAIEQAIEILDSSALTTGYLTIRTAIPGRQVLDIGGLDSMDALQLSRKEIVHVNTDGMRFENVARAFRPDGHLPTLFGARVAPDSYATDVLAGYAEMYHFVIENRASLLDVNGPLANFSEQLVRVVMRPTELYSLVMRRSLNPDSLSDGADWSAQLEILSRVSQDDELLHADFLRSERDALAALDIPRYATSTNAQELGISAQGAASIPFRTSGYGQVQSRLRQFSSATMTRDIDLVRNGLRIATAGSFSETENWPRDSDAGGLSVESLANHQVYLLADRIAASAIECDGGAAWIGAVPLPGEEKMQLEVLGHDLYAGNAGIALFFAALAQSSKRSQFFDLAYSALAPLRNELSDSLLRKHLQRRLGIGGATGLGSLIYALAKVGSFLGDQNLVDEAVEAALSGLTADIIRRDQRLDVIEGTAGAALALLAVHKASGNTEVLDRAVICCYHLISRQSAQASGGSAWTIGDNQTLTGFSHGASGIALALAKAYQITQEPAFCSGVLQALEYERSVFSQPNGNWPDFRDGMSQAPSYLCQWCHGATGIGLARLGILDAMGRLGTLGEDLAVALRTTLNVGFVPLDSLCCGNLGRIDFLFTAGHQLAQKDLTALALARVGHLFYRALRDRGFVWKAGGDSYNPGLFTGLAGAGYQLLRLAEPSRFPCILMWE
jgi:type 2 lantibiotic biosynthesis protein LanM